MLDSGTGAPDKVCPCERLDFVDAGGSNDGGGGRSAAAARMTGSNGGGVVEPGDTNFNEGWREVVNYRLNCSETRLESQNGG